ncbi:MAG: hypothetical protein M1830_006329 [Pleopsidium flavum]|nr:MAG: hypothetical protein M1830_006329 [Pleopsidium flavum]
MRVALKQLGYEDTYHMQCVLENPLDAVMWSEALDAKYFGKGKPFEREEWDMLLGHCQAVCDMPTAAFMPELIAAYPSAKVVLTERHPDAWHKSCTDTVMSFTSSTKMDILRFLDPQMDLRFSMFDKMTNGVFGSRTGFVEHGKEIYVDMHEEVRKLVPKERLLEYKLGEGWERLCAFLGEEVPTTEFPRINETAEFAERAKLMGQMTILRVAKRLLVPVGAAVAVGIAYYFYL